MRWLVRLAALALIAAGIVGYRERTRTTIPEEGAPAHESTEPEKDVAPSPSEPSASFQLSEVAVTPKDPWPAENLRGIQFLRDGEFDEAIELFRRCAEAVPDEPAYRGNWAEALVRLALAQREKDRDPVAALATLERALEVDPSREQDLRSLLEKWRAEARVESEFSDFHSPYFELSFDGSRAEVLHASQRFLDVLEEAYTDFRLWFGHDPVLEGRPPFRVVLYRRGEFEQLTGLGDWAAGAFDGTIRLPLEERSVEGEGWRVVARHELVHAFLRELGGADVPGWLNEGLAQWLEGPTAGVVRGARERLRGRELFPLERLRATLSGWDDANEIRAAYDQSLVFTDYLLANYGETVVVQLVEGCRAGTDPSATFLAKTGVDLALVLGDLAADLR